MNSVPYITKLCKSKGKFLKTLQVFYTLQIEKLVYAAYKVYKVLLN